MKQLLILLFLVSNLSYSEPATFDELGRLLSYPGKVIVPCPDQDKDTAVIFVLGQSNSANHGSEKFITQHPSNVYNYFNGKCYIASSPLLGATGSDGEFITLLADNLIDKGDFKDIIIVSTGVAGTRIEPWAKGGNLYSMVLHILSQLNSKYTVTHVLWHQGESDFNYTSTYAYMRRFYSMTLLFRKPFSRVPPIFYAVSTKCGDNNQWESANSISTAQKLLQDSKKGLFIAVNTDELLEYEDRNETRCHFSRSGQIKTAEAYTNIIHAYHKHLSPLA